MNIPAQQNSPPEALHLALAQIANALKACGAENLDRLIKDEKGYAQIIWLLEKLVRLWFECQQLPHQPPLTSGLSPEADRELQRKLESMP